MSEYLAIMEDLRAVLLRYERQTGMRLGEVEIIRPDGLKHTFWLHEQAKGERKVTITIGEQF